MSKFIILGDLHLGVRSDSLVFANYQLNYLDEVIDYMIANKIKLIVQLGDVFDRRKFSNHVILDMWETRFFDKLAKLGIKLHILIGNHDSAYKNSIKVNSPTLFLSKYKNVFIYDEPTDVELFGSSFLFLPWICQENYAKSIESINESKSSHVFGHLELAGFEMLKGQINHDGLDMTLFKRFEGVFTGHFHTMSSNGNVSYLGCPYEFTWADYDDPRGFHVFDVTTLQKTFHRNPNRMFYKFEYDDKDKPNDYWKTFDITNLTNKYLKVIVINKTDSYQFDRLVDALYNAGLSDFKIIEDFGDLSADNIDDDDLEMEDSMTLVDSYVEASEFEGDKTKLKDLMKSLYVSSLEVLD